MRTPEELEKFFGENLTSLAKKITNDFIQHRDIQIASAQHEKLKGKGTSDYDDLFFKNLLLLGFYEEALSELNKLIKYDRVHIAEDVLIKAIIKFRFELNCSVLNANHVVRLSHAWLKPLTKFGKDNYNALLEILNIIIETKYQTGFLEKFYSTEKGQIKSTYLKEYYIQFYQLGAQSEKDLKTIADRLYSNPSGKATKKDVESAIGNASANLLREAENSLRLSIGGKPIGEGHIRETELYYKIKTHYSDLKVHQHGRPKFLGRQHFDIWIPEVKLAIEYQGAQHDRPVGFFGGEEAFINNLKRDEEKRQKCFNNDVHLIEVRPDYLFEEVVSQVNSVIFSRK